MRPSVLRVIGWILLFVGVAAALFWGFSMWLVGEGLGTIAGEEAEFRAIAAGAIAGIVVGAALVIYARRRPKPRRPQRRRSK